MNNAVLIPLLSNAEYYSKSRLALFCIRMQTHQNGIIHRKLKVVVCTRDLLAANNTVWQRVYTYRVYLSRDVHTCRACTQVPVLTTSSTAVYRSKVVTIQSAEIVSPL
jgi:hypothetical protein